jgi:SAM-dependent methyltransferase
MHVDYQSLSNELAANGTLELQSAGEDLDSMLRGLPLARVRKALDVGCGSGAMTRLLAQHLPAAEIWGLDLSPSHVEYAQALGHQEGLGNLHYICGDIFAASADLPKNFDLICEKYVLMSMVGDAKAHAFLARMKEHLCRGGVLVLIESDVNFGQDRYPEPPEPLRSVLPRIVTYYRERGTIEWRCGLHLYKHLKSAGFNNVEVSLADARIMKGGAPLALVEHACTDVEDLIVPCLTEMGFPHLVREVAQQWRDYLRGQDHFIYNPVFIGCGTAA